MRPAQIDIVALVAILAATGFHRAFCEWRWRSYAIDVAVTVESRLLLSLRNRSHSQGNAERWDAAVRANGPRLIAWAKCREPISAARPPAERAAEARCFANHRFPVHDLATRAVASVECDRQRFGRVPDRAAIETCLAERGFPAGALPRFTSDAIGPRYGQAYRERFGLWAESKTADADGDRLSAWQWGIGLPFALTTSGVWIAVLARRRRGPPARARPPQV